VEDAEITFSFNIWPFILFLIITPVISKFSYLVFNCKRCENKSPFIGSYPFYYDTFLKMSTTCPWILVE
jgi:hypothetical protein